MGGGLGIIENKNKKKKSFSENDFTFCEVDKYRRGLEWNMNLSAVLVHINILQVPVSQDKLHGASAQGWKQYWLKMLRLRLIAGLECYSSQCQLEAPHNQR